MVRCAWELVHRLRDERKEGPRGEGETFQLWGALGGSRGRPGRETVCAMQVKIRMFDYSKG